MGKKDESTLNEHDLEKIGYYQYLATIVGYGESNNLVDESVYKKIPTKALSLIVKEYPKNKLAKKELEAREIELKDLDVNDADSYVKRFLETSDKAFIVESIKKGVYVFVQLSNPRAKKYIDFKERILNRVNLLDLEDLKELKEFFERYKNEFGNYTINQLNEQFNKRITIGKDGCSYQQTGVNEDQWKADIDSFVKEVLEPKIEKLQNGIFYKGEYISFENEEAIFVFTRKSHILEVHKCIVENNSNISNLPKKSFNTLINALKKIRDEMQNRESELKEGGEWYYFKNQTDLIILLLSENELNTRARDKYEKQTQLINKIDTLVGFRDLRKKFYLPELDDLLLRKIDPICERFCTHHKYSNDFPFDFKLKVIATTEEESSVVLGYTIKILSEYNRENDIIDSNQLRMAFERILSKMSFKEKMQLLLLLNDKSMKEKNLIDEDWLFKALYSELIEQLLVKDGNDNFITNMEQREYIHTIIPFFTKTGVIEDIIDNMKNLDQWLSCISFGNIVNKRSNIEPILTISEIMKALKEELPSEMQKDLTTIEGVLKGISESERTDNFKDIQVGE